MAKSTLSFICQNCGAAYNRWQGKCESCSEWNTLSEEDITGATTMPVSIRSRRKGRLFTLAEGTVPRLIVIDSIQTMWTDTVESAPGTVTQVRASAQALIRFAKKSGAAIILVGHVTKDGQIAGPRVVEHMVDAVLSFEGEGSQQFR